MGCRQDNLGKPLTTSEYVLVRGENGILYDHKDNRTNISFSLEHNVLLSHWTLSAGLIANMNTSIDHSFRLYPGIDIAYRPKTNWKLYASYSKGFRLPTFTDLYYKSPTLNGNTDLRPEVNHSMQIGTRYTRQGIQGTLRLFYNRGHNMIDWVMYTPTDTYHSTSFELDNMGAQAETKLNFKQLCKKDIFIHSLSVGYTYIHQHRRDNQIIFKSNYALEYLRHKFVASLNHKIYSKLNATWSIRWQERMGNYSPYTTLDLKLQWTDKHYEIFAKGTNITNKRYYDLGCVRQPGIWVLAGARFNCSF